MRACRFVLIARFYVAAFGVSICVLFVLLYLGAKGWFCSVYDYLVYCIVWDLFVFMVTVGYDGACNVVWIASAWILCAVL